MARPNILFITLDQFRGDSLSCAGHPLVETPHLDELAAEGVRLARHYSQAAPCAPGRAALYTGTYQTNNRVVANGTPLDDRFDNIARVAARGGYRPTLFGYTDQGVDPRDVLGSDDPRLSNYEGILPGFDAELDLPGECTAWLEWLADEHGHHFDRGDDALSTEHERPAELSVSAFLTDRLLGWVDRQDGPWFAHASYLRPHPPYSAAGRFARMYRPEDCAPPVPAQADPSGLHRVLLGIPYVAAPADPADMQYLQSQYFGMISEVDAQLGRIWEHLRRAGEWDDTIVIVTSDHGEQLGDQGLLHKVGFFESSYHVLGIVRDPRCPSTFGTVVDRFTENIDVMPTLCELLGLPIPAQCDGYPLTPFLDGVEPPSWRDAAYYEWDWRDSQLPTVGDGRPWDRSLEQMSLAVRRSEHRAFVQFGNGTWRCFDLATDPTWRTEEQDPSVVLAEATAMLAWRSSNLDRTMTGLLLRDGGVGRFPPPRTT